jgi:hypothetical protein
VKRFLVDGFRDGKLQKLRIGRINLKQKTSFYYCTHKLRYNTYINSWSEIQLIPLIVGEVEGISQPPPATPNIIPKL